MKLMFIVDINRAKQTNKATEQENECKTKSKKKVIKLERNEQERSKSDSEIKNLKIQ